MQTPYDGAKGTPPFKNNNCLWQPCLLTNQDEMSNLYRGSSSSIDVSYQVSVHLVKWFPRKNLEIDQSETRIACESGCDGLLVSDWLISKNYSTLKPPGQMNQHLVGNILGRLSIKANQGILKMWPLWAVVLYIQVKIICTIH
jgi:hypothetical protein